jgi:hypothetical protein
VLAVGLGDALDPFGLYGYGRQTLPFPSALNHYREGTIMPHGRFLNSPQPVARGESKEPRPVAFNFNPELIDSKRAQRSSDDPNASRKPHAE